MIKVKFESLSSGCLSYKKISDSIEIAGPILRLLLDDEIVVAAVAVVIAFVVVVAVATVVTHCLCFPGWMRSTLRPNRPAIPSESMRLPNRPPPHP